MQRPHDGSQWDRLAPGGGRDRLNLHRVDVHALQRSQQRLQAALPGRLGHSGSEFSDAEASAVLHRLFEASEYSLMNGGKRVRATLVYATAAALSESSNDAVLDDCACALEMIHAYSLVHDDLPAMDDDDLRRGKPTCHIAYDEATAILVGDGLQSRAFELLADLDLPAERNLAMVKLLAAASGPRGGSLHGADPQ